MTRMPPMTNPSLQRGVSTLAVTLILLVIMTAMVLFSTSVGYFEQRTTTNQNRARIAEQSSEYALALAGEYLKANRGRLISDDVADLGWFATGSERWAECSDVGTADAAALDAEFPAGHPCLSERDVTRRVPVPGKLRARRMAADRHRRSGGVAASVSIAIASSRLITFWCCSPSVRTATVPSSASRLPTTSRCGTLASECSRTL